MENQENQIPVIEKKQRGRKKLPSDIKKQNDLKCRSNYYQKHKAAINEQNSKYQKKMTTDLIEKNKKLFDEILENGAHATAKKIMYNYIQRFPNFFGRVLNEGVEEKNE